MNDLFFKITQFLLVVSVKKDFSVTVKDFEVADHSTEKTEFFPCRFDRVFMKHENIQSCVEGDINKI
jgi:hypothetical protein